MISTAWGEGVLFLAACYILQHAISYSVLFLAACYFLQCAIWKKIVRFHYWSLRNNRMINNFILGGAVEIFLEKVFCSR